MEWLSKPWPWYIAGPLIGLMVPLLLIGGNKTFGISSSLRHICAACFPGNNSFFRVFTALKLIYCRVAFDNEGILRKFLKDNAVNDVNNLRRCGT